MPKIKTIYQYFNEYPKEQVDAVLEKLTEEERALITMRYGEDLNNPIPGKLTREQNNRFYGSLAHKIKKLLSSNKEQNQSGIANTTIIPEQKQPIMESAKEISSDMEVALTESSKDSVLDTEIEPKKELKSENIYVDSTIQVPSEIQDDSKKITKEDGEKVLELLRTSTFAQMMSVLTVKESVIISLKLGYIDGKYFSTDSIAQFLGIEAQEVIDTTRKVLLLCKENINQFIDDAIKIVTEQTKQSVKTL